MLYASVQLRGQSAKISVTVTRLFLLWGMIY